MKTKDKLKELALDMRYGKIFSDRHLAQYSNIGLADVFTVLKFLDPEDFEKFNKRVESGDVALVYEYIAEAAPLTINGAPSFFSCNTLNRREADIMFDYYEKIKSSVDVAMAD